MPVTAFCSAGKMAGGQTPTRFVCNAAYPRPQFAKWQPEEPGGVRQGVSASGQWAGLEGVRHVQAENEISENAAIAKDWRKLRLVQKVTLT